MSTSADVGRFDNVRRTSSNPLTGLPMPVTNEQIDRKLAEVLNEVRALDRKLDLIFGGSVIIDGRDEVEDETD